jgi:peptidoglycan/xylan/chitin deacetylase (PgdA/CDA1 family)
LVRAVRRAQRAASFLPRQLLGTITHVSTSEPVVALTFDDGPDPASTPKFLDLLEARGARATFFLVGRSAQKYPALVKRMVQGGHEVGNHSWDHPSFPTIAAAERRRQIRACAQVVGQNRSKLFRPPFGDQTLRSRLDPLWLGWEVIAWNVCGVDWRDDNAGDIAERIIREVRPGSIVLLHDALYQYEDVRFASREPALRALEIVLDALRSTYRFVTVSELLRHGSPNRELWAQAGEPDYLARLKSGTA